MLRFLIVLLILASIMLVAQSMLNREIRTPAGETVRTRELPARVRKDLQDAMRLHEQRLRQIDEGRNPNERPDGD